MAVNKVQGTNFSITYTTSGLPEFSLNLQSKGAKAVYKWVGQKIKTTAMKRIKERAKTYTKKGHESWGVRSQPGKYYKGHIGWPGFRSEMKVDSEAKDVIGFGYKRTDPSAEEFGDNLEYGSRRLESHWLANLKAFGKPMSQIAWNTRNARYAASYAKAQAAAAARRAQKRKQAQAAKKTP